MELDVVAAKAIIIINMLTVHVNQWTPLLLMSSASFLAAVLMRISIISNNHN